MRVEQSNSELQIGSNGDAITPDAVDQFAADQIAEERAIGYLRAIWKNLGFLLRVALAGMACSLAIVLLIHRRFEATTRLMPPDDRSSSGLSMLAASISGQAGALGSMASDMMGVKSSGALFVGILGSRSIEDRLIARFQLKQAYGENLSTDARRRLEANTSIVEDRKSGIITITVSDRDPKRAAAIARGYVEELDQLVTQLSTSSAHRERVFLEDRLKSVKLDLDAAAEKLGQFSSKNSTIDIQTQGKAMVDAVSQLQGQMIAAQTQLQGLRQIYTNNNVRVREAEARIEEFQRQLEKLGGTTLASASLKNVTAAGNDSSYPSIRQLPLLGITFADLYRRTKIEEAVFETLTQQFELAKVQEAKETPSVKVLDEAVPPERKSYPPRAVIVGLGTMIFTALGVGWILVSASWAASDPMGPNKLFAMEIREDFRNHVAEISRRHPAVGGVARFFFNGSGAGSAASKP